MLPFRRPKPGTPPEPGCEPVPGRRPDVVVPMFAAAFCLGVVVAAAGLLGLQAGDEATVPADEHQVVVEERAAAEAVAAARLTALEDAAALNRRLVAALDSPPVTAADLAALRREVATQTNTVEKVRVVRVPVPGPVVTVAPAQRSRQPARASHAAAVPVPPLRSCRLELLGTCLARIAD